jgi:hypothetical protein
MDRDLKLGGVGEHDGRDNITQGEGRWGRLIGETKNGILESWSLCAYNLAHFVQALHNLFRTMADGIRQAFRV